MSTFEPLSILVYNERVKLTAALSNTIAAALIAFGLLRPFFDGGLASWPDRIASLVALAAALAVHLLTRLVLTQLRSEEAK